MGNYSIAVIGAGAVGGTISGRMISAGMDVTLVGRDASWLNGIRRSGFSVSGPGQKPKHFRPAQFMAAVKPPRKERDLVLICVKSGDTRAAISKIKPLVGPKTSIVSLQNGLTHVEMIRRKFGAAQTVFGITIIAAHRSNRFTIRHEGGGEIYLAPHTGNRAAFESALRILRQSGWKPAAAPAEDRLLWTKAAFNACTNPIGALTGRTNGELISIPALREIVERALTEAIRTAAKDGHRPLYSFKEMIRVIEKQTAANQPNSMLQDIRAGRKTEADAILGPILAAARLRKTAAPTLNALYRFVTSLEKELQA